MMTRALLFVFVCLGVLADTVSAHASRSVEPDRGVVAHLIVTGDLDAQSMTDEIVNWISKRDSDQEVLAVISFDGARARPDMASRIAKAVRSSPVPVAVHLDRPGSVSAQFLLIGLASKQLTASRGVRVADGAATRLEDLCQPAETGWKGAHERLTRSILGGRDEVLLDLFVKPLDDVYLHREGGVWTVARARQSEEDVRIVDRIDDDDWNVDLPHEALTGLELALEANGLGQVLRANNVRAFRRVRTQVRSGLTEALAQVEHIRKDVSARVIRLEGAVRDTRALEPRHLDGAVRELRLEIADAREQLDDARGILDRYPELYRMSPPWVFESDPSQRRKDWAKAFKTLTSAIDGLGTDLDALEKP
jgi:hypothetical protein